MFAPLKQFLHLESASGIVLMAAAALAMLAANSGLAPAYEALCASSFSFFVNDGLMAVFFLVIGIEIKRELTDGELSTRAQALLPCVAALAGVITPAIIYSLFNWGTPMMRGWAIPSATDIAFSLGVLALFGDRIPASLKVFLMAVAVIDDLAAVVIIGVFYTDSLDYVALAVAVACAAGVWMMNRRAVGCVWAYVLTGILMWAAMLQSGIHPTVAGVLLGLLMPLKTGETVVAKIHHWVAFGIVPLFAFANAGIPLSGLSAEQITSPVTAGIMLGLLLGKQAGIFMASWVLIRFGWAKLPSGAGWLEFYAVCVIAGIGFTMSLFIGTLAFHDSMLQLFMRLGVMMGSLLAALFGSVVMALAIRRRSGAS